jgi:SecD/SecF fusion protein
VAAGAVALVVSTTVGCGSDDDDDASRRVDTSDDIIGTFAAAEPPASSEDLDAAVEVMKRRVEALDVGKVDIRRDGDQIIVRIDDPADREAVLTVVGVLGDLRFRPVLMEAPIGGDEAQLDQTLPVTPPEGDTAEANVVLEADARDFRYQLGPAAASDRIVETAQASYGETGEWQVKLTLAAGRDGIDAFNRVASSCYLGDTTCPTRKVAIVFDSVVQSAPLVQASSFKRDQIQIVGKFTKQEAEDLALVLSSGTLPIELERQTVQQAG